jgi:glycosyltransferase involved in cell wall biosynthesis
MLCTTCPLAKKTSFSYEILIQDATSTDNTDAIIKKFHTLPIKFASAPDGGIYDAWNKALARRCGEWAIFIGAGDIVCWKNLERCIKIIKKLPQTVDFYITPVKLITNAGRVLTISAFAQSDKKFAARNALPPSWRFSPEQRFLCTRL